MATLESFSVLALRNFHADAPIVLPSGTAEGDLLVAVINYRGTEMVSPPTPAGWTLLAHFSVLQTRVIDDGAVFYKVAGSDEADPTFEKDGNDLTAWMGRFSSAGTPAAAWSAYQASLPFVSPSIDGASGDLSFSSVFASRAEGVFTTPADSTREFDGNDDPLPGNTNNARDLSIATRVLDSTSSGTFSWDRATAGIGQPVTILVPNAAAASGPTIDTQPTSQTVTAPASAEFGPVAATGEGALSYQWRYRVGSGGTPANVDFGTGGTSTTFNTGVNTTSRSGWQFQVQVTDDNGTTDSSWATLTVEAAAAPVLTNPVALSPGQTTVTPRVTTDTGNGTLYYVLYPGAQDDASAAQVVAGEDATGSAAISAGSASISETGTVTFSQVTGLTPSTSYKISFVHEGNPDG